MEEGEVVVGVAVAAGGDSSSCFQPGVGAFDGPAVARLGVACFELSFFAAPDFSGWCVGRDRLAGSAWFADPWFDLAFAECGVDCLRGVAAVGPEFVWADAACDQLVDQRQQVALLVFVAGREANCERCAVGVYGEVVAAALCAAERARDLCAPFFASTSDASTISLDQSSNSASAS